MRFTPRTEEEVQKEANKFGPWASGTYDFEIVEAEEKTSAKGNEMIALTIHVFNNEGDRRIVYDYLLESIQHKLKHAAESCGLHSQYSSGQLSGHDFYGKTGRLKLGIQPEKDGYPAKNVVRDYITTSAATFKTPSVRAKAPAGDLDDEIPF